MPPVNEHEVLFMNDFPDYPYVKVGSFVPTSPAFSQRIDCENPVAAQFFKSQAAAMGGNTIVVHEIPGNAAQNKLIKVEVIYVKEDVGSHGGDELGPADGVIPWDEEMMQIY